MFLKAFIAAKEKLEIVSGAASPPFGLFAGGVSPPAAAKWVRANLRIEHRFNY